MKRGLSKTAAILSIIIYSLTTTVFALMFFVGLIFSDIASDIKSIIGNNILYSLGGAIAIISLPLLIISILQIVFSANILKSVSAPKEKFAKKFGIIITSIVISFFFLFFSVYSMIATLGLVNIIETAALVLIIVFYIVDMAKNKKFVASTEQGYTSQNAYHEQQSSQPIYSDSSVDLGRNYRPTQTTSSDFEAKLQRLVSLRQQGMLTQDEFEKLKQNLIDNELK